MARLAVEQMLSENPDLSVNEINAGLMRASMKYNRRPQRELGGLSPDRVRLLLQDPWDGSGVLHLNDQIPIGDLSSSRLLGDARAILFYLEEKGEVPATATLRHFTRATLADLAPRLSWSEEYPWEEVLSRRGNEEDLFPLHLLRLLLGLAGLMKMRNRKFSLTARGRTLLRDERAGELFALLFRTQFQEMNLAYIWQYGPPLSSLQQTISFILYRIGRVAADWRSSQRLLTETLLPTVSEDLAELPDWVDSGSILEGRVLLPLAGFGLLRVKETQRRGHRPTMYHFRKGALYDRFLHFSFPD